MDKKSVIDFFDKCAPTWDAEMIKSDAIINRILDNAEVGAGMTVLDVACGTGVMFDYYLSRGVESVVGIDISPEMAKIAAEKYAAEPRVQVICGDVEEYAFDRKFDRVKAIIGVSPASAVLLFCQALVFLANRDEIWYPVQKHKE